MNNRITPYNITELKTNEIFVFGSNSNGVHNGNAAATAMKFGAIMGQAVGIQGQTYALPSKHIENLKKHIDGTTFGIYFFSYRDRMWNIQTFAI